MDNRTDVTEDLQATPQHPPLQPKNGGLTAGPHNDPPPSKGIEDTYRAPANVPPSRTASAWQSLQQAAGRYPLQFALSAAALGLAVAVLSLRRTRAR